MIHPIHLAACQEGFAFARDFVATPYKNLGGLQNVLLDKSLHIISEGNSTFSVYPEPNSFGAAKPNEIGCRFLPQWQNGPSSTVNDIRGTPGTTTLTLFDDGGINYIFASVTQTEDLYPTLLFGVNGVPYVNVALSPIPHAGFLYIAIGAVQGIAYINEPTSLSGFSYAINLPAGWSHGLHTGQITFTGVPIVLQIGMRTAVYDWGAPGWQDSGVKPLGYMSGQKAGNGLLNPRVFADLHFADFGGVAAGNKHDLFLDAAPYGYYSASPAPHLSAIGALQTSALLTSSVTLAPQEQLTSGSLNIALSASGQVPNLLTGSTSYSTTVENALPSVEEGQVYQIIPEPSPTVSYVVVGYDCSERDSGDGLSDGGTSGGTTGGTTGEDAGGEDDAGEDAGGEDDAGEDEDPFAGCTPILEEVYSDTYQEGLDSVNATIEAWYNEPIPSGGEALNPLKWETQAVLAKSVSNERVTAYLKVSGFAVSNTIEFSKGSTENVLSAGASRLKEAGQDLRNAYYATQYTLENSFCFWDILHDPGTTTLVSTINTYRRVLNREFEERCYQSSTSGGSGGGPTGSSGGGSSGGSVGGTVGGTTGPLEPQECPRKEWVLTLGGWELVATTVVTSQQNLGARKIVSSQQRVSAARAGSPFNTSLGQLTLS